MSFLKTDGFDRLVAEAAVRARTCAFVGECVKVALTLDGHVPDGIGVKALTAAEKTLLDAAAELPLVPAEERGDFLVLAETGRLQIALENDGPPESGHLLGMIDWGSERPDDISRKLTAMLDRARADFRSLRSWLAGLPADEIVLRLDNIRYSVVHMAPVLIYVGDRAYSTLDRFSNLPGKALAYGAPGCLLSRLAETPVNEWAEEDAGFVACLNALLMSGPPVRAEEFNGAQLLPAELEPFLRDRIAEYGEPLPVSTTEQLGPWLEKLAEVCVTARGKVLRSGATFYRDINGITLHKRELALRPAITYADVPSTVKALLAARDSEVWTTGVELGKLDGPARELIAKVVSSPTPEGFASPFEGFLHEFLLTGTEALRADVSMSRGPRDLAQLRAAAPRSPLTLATKDCFCCVTASKAFVRKFGDDRFGLAKALCAYSARMRFNTWHYLPHSLSLTAELPGRDDWYFAPMMPDVAEWSDQHHTGHVMFGVRYAIRVPFGIDFEGAYRVGLYDLRFMRTAEPRFEIDDLRAAIALAQVLSALYQAMSEHEYVVTNFTNEWFRGFHG
jgi:hypothetical protein